MVRHLLAAIPRQRFIEFVWKLVSVLDKCADDGLCIFSTDLRKHEVARLPLHQRCDLAILAAETAIGKGTRRSQSPRNLESRHRGHDCSSRSRKSFSECASSFR